MIIGSLIISLILSSKFIKGNTSASNINSNINKPTEKPESLIKAKFNFTSNGSFSGEFGRYDNSPPIRKSEQNKPEVKGTVFNSSMMGQSIFSTTEAAFLDPNKEIMKELIANLISSNFKIGNRFAKRFCDEGFLDSFRPNFTHRIPFKAPLVFGHSEKCVNKNNRNWCKAEPVTSLCTWVTDCFCMSSITCGPTKPLPEHRDKWCFGKPDVYPGHRTFLPCMQRYTLPICTTTMYTPCGTFTPPCVHPTRNTIEPCVCPTNAPTCPCPALFNEPDLFSFLVKRADQLPLPLRSSAIALLKRHLRKRSAYGQDKYTNKK